MKAWTELYDSKGVYQSNVIDASSSFDFYITTLSLDYIENDGLLNVEIRVSNDNGFTWTDWIDISNGNNYPYLFNNEEISMEYTKFQYRVLMDMSKDVYGTSPVFNQISIMLNGGYKIENTGDVLCYPELWIKKTGGHGDIELTNETTGKKLKFTGINSGETIYVDCQNKDIVSDLPLTYRYNNHNGVYLDLDVGENILTGVGNYELQIRHQFRVLQG